VIRHPTASNEELPRTAAPFSHLDVSTSALSPDSHISQLAKFRSPTTAIGGGPAGRPSRRPGTREFPNGQLRTAGLDRHGPKRLVSSRYGHEQ
jgi:hypothetical protein